MKERREGQNGNFAYPLIFPSPLPRYPLPDILSPPSFFCCFSFFPSPLFVPFFLASPPRTPELATADLEPGRRTPATTRHTTVPLPENQPRLGWFRPEQNRTAGEFGACKVISNSSFIYKLYSWPRFFLIAVNFIRNCELGFWVWWCPNLTQRQPDFWAFGVRI